MKPRLVRMQDLAGVWFWLCYRAADATTGTGTTFEGAYQEWVKCARSDFGLYPV